MISCIVIIPSYEPIRKKINNVVRNLIRRGIKDIIIVDDGSGSKFNHIFEELNELSEVLILKHHVNLGKGEALKTAFNYVMVNKGNAYGVITVDSDGQHKSHDVVNIISKASKDKKSIHLGIRDFSGEKIPFKSKFGNVVTRNLLSLVVGGSIKDTQTGLRYIPRQYISELMALKSGGFAFELDVLIHIISKDIPIIEVPIETVYEDGNSGTHFNPLFDSVKVYFTLFRFSFISIMTSIIDFFVFSIMFTMFGSIAMSVPAGRLLAGSFNYYFNRKFVFKSKDKVMFQMVKYISLVVVMMLLSYGLILFCVNMLSINVFLSKLIVEVSLFIFSFSVQRTLIFKK